MMHLHLPPVFESFTKTPSNGTTKYGIKSLLSMVLFGITLLSSPAQAERCNPIKIEKGCAPFALDYFVTNQTTGQVSPLQVWYTPQGTFYRQSNGALMSWQPLGKKLYFRRWIEQDRLVIEYEPSDLSSLGHRNLQWEQVRGLMASETLNQMHFVQKSKWNGYDSTILSSKEHTQEVEMLKGYQVPVKVITQNRPTMVLARLYETEQVQEWLANFAGFERMDYSDIGDNENDKRVANLIHQGFVPGHSSSTHSH